MTYMPEVTRCRQSAVPVDDFEPSVYILERVSRSPLVRLASNDVRPKAAHRSSKSSCAVAVGILGAFLRTRSSNLMSLFSYGD